MGNRLLILWFFTTHSLFDPPPPPPPPPSFNKFQNSKIHMLRFFFIERDKQISRKIWSQKVFELEWNHVFYFLTYILQDPLNFILFNVTLSNFVSEIEYGKNMTPGLLILYGGHDWRHSKYPQWGPVHTFWDNGMPQIALGCISSNYFYRLKSWMTGNNFVYFVHISLKM